MKIFWEAKIFSQGISEFISSLNPEVEAEKRSLCFFFFNQSGDNDTSSFHHYQSEKWFFCFVFACNIWFFFFFRLYIYICVYSYLIKISHWILIYFLSTTTSLIFQYMHRLRPKIIFEWHKTNRRNSHSFDKWYCNFTCKNDCKRGDMQKTVNQIWIIILARHYVL